MTSSSDQYQISIANSSKAADWSAIEDQWEELAQTSQHPFAFHQSPAWWDYTIPVSKGEQTALGIVKAPDGSLAGVIPAQAYEHFLEYGVRSFLPGKARLLLVKLLGHEPLVPNDEAAFVNLTRSLLETFKNCDGIYLEWVSVGSECWNMIARSQELRRNVLVHIPTRLEACRFITLPDSFDAYLAKFKAKTRNTLRRKVKRLREHGGGRLDCVRIDHEDDVPTFVKASAEIAIQSRLHKKKGWTVMKDTPEMRHKYAGLARRGILRSYLLRCGDEYCAFVRGFQYHDTYYYTSVGFAEPFAALSPGGVMLYMLIEDLCRHQPPKRLNFYTGGEWIYKEIFGTDAKYGACVLLLRKTIRNHFLRSTHAALQTSIETVRHLVARTRSSKSAGPGED